MASTTTSGTPIKTYIVEHLDDELGPWSELEYLAIARETEAAGGARFCLSSLPPALRVPDALRRIPAFAAETRGVEDLFAPGDGSRSRVCLLDPAAASDLSPEDGDRTSELRKKGFEGRRLGPVQMSTDTAVRVTRMVVQGKTPLNEIPYVDSPELRFNKHESTELPFRYVKGEDGKPIMPEGMVDLIRQDADRGIVDLL